MKDSGTSALQNLRTCTRLEPTNSSPVHPDIKIAEEPWAEPWAFLQDYCVGTTQEIEKIYEKCVAKALRKSNFERKRGEFNTQFIQWLHDNEQAFRNKIQKAIHNYSDNKARCAYYGIIHNIITYFGCYLLGKNSTPIEISYRKYCEVLGFPAENMRKTLTIKLYGHDYMGTIIKRKKKKPVNVPYREYEILEPICENIANEIYFRFIK